MKNIVENRKVKHEYFIEETFEAGVVLEGWEVKSLRLGKCQLVDSYVRFLGYEPYVVGSLITPLGITDTLKKIDSRRDRKLLLNKNEMIKLRSKVETKGYTLICLSLYWKQGKVKASIGLCKGKQLHDKRAADKEKTLSKELTKINKYI